MNDDRMVEQVITLVCKTYGLTREQLHTRTRKMSVVMPRHVAIHLLRCLTKMTQVRIGEVFGLDHTTVANSLNRVRGWIDESEDFNATVRRLKLKLREISWLIAQGKTACYTEKETSAPVRSDVTVAGA